MYRLSVQHNQQRGCNNVRGVKPFDWSAQSNAAPHPPGTEAVKSTIACERPRMELILRIRASGRRVLNVEYEKVASLSACRVVWNMLPIAAESK